MKRKRSLWTKYDERLLLDLWEKNIVELRKLKRNSHIYGRIADQLQTHTIDEVHMKVNNFTQRYRSEKLNAMSGGTPSNWKHYERVKNILGESEENNSNSVKESIFLDVPEPTTECPNNDRPSTSSSPVIQNSPIPNTLCPLIVSVKSEYVQPPSPPTSAQSNSLDGCDSRPKKKKKNSIAFQMEAMTIAKENHKLMQEQFKFSQTIMKEQLEMSRRSVQLLEQNTANSIAYGKNIVELSQKQVELQKDLVEFMKGLLNK